MLFSCSKRKLFLSLNMSSYAAAVSLVLLTIFVSSGSAIKCWECNSKYDARCRDPFSNFSVALVDCDQRQSTVSHLTTAAGEEMRASLCRKTVQTVEHETRIIRSCGWVENAGYLKERACFNRAGTNQVQMYHCVCQGDSCNRAVHLALPKVELLATLALVLLPSIPAAFFINH